VVYEPWSVYSRGRGGFVVAVDFIGAETGESCLVLKVSMGALARLAWRVCRSFSATMKTNGRKNKMNSVATK
jgi:hypothetical protein